MRNSKVPLLLTMLLLMGCTLEETSDLQMQEATFEDLQKQINPTSRVYVQTADLYPFMPAGPLGGEANLLNPGDFFPPTKSSKATLKRGNDYIQFNIHTTGLPPGAYTVWYVIFNNPGECNGPGDLGGACAEPDLFLSSTAVVWATGKVVKANGVGNFSDRIYVGEQRSETILLGGDLTAPLANPKGCEVHLIIKYHGAASDDPDILYAQLSTLLGNCGPGDGSNSFDAGPAFGIQCFDPQLSIFPGL